MSCVVLGGAGLAGKAIGPFVIALAEVINEVEEEYGVVDDNGIGELLCEALITNPRFSWISENIWNDVDATVRN